MLQTAVSKGAVSLYNRYENTLKKGDEYLLEKTALVSSQSSPLTREDDKDDD